MADFRMTEQRKRVLAAVREDRTHPTADEVHRCVRESMPRVSLATVYRNLDLMCERGLIRMLDGGSGPRRYDARTSRHDHIRCLVCGRVEDVPPRAGVGPPPRELMGFRVVDYRLEYLGMCPHCRAAGHDAPGRGAQRKQAMGEAE